MDVRQDHKQEYGKLHYKEKATQTGFLTTTHTLHLL